MIRPAFLDHFRSPVIRLTAWYVLIIMIISVTFSLIMYRQATTQFRAGFLPHDRFFQLVEPRFGPLFVDPIARLLEERYQTVARRLRYRLITLNLVIFGGAGLTSYWLAKRTLRPIEQSLDDQRRFTANASHELRTPLAAMKTEIEVALRQPDPAEQRRVLGSTLEEIGKLEHLSSSLLQLARQEDERRRPVVESVHFDRVVDQACRRIKPIADRKQIALHHDGIVGTIRGDQAGLIEVLVILLDNAIKYSPDRSAIEIHGQWTKKHLTLIVRDRGQGIAAADLPHVFDRFYRADQARIKHGTDGYGLGLPIAKQIIERHHGSIAIDSAVGEGATVTVTLPRN